MRKWSTFTGHTEHGPAVFIQLETVDERLAVPVLFHHLTAKQTYAERVRGIIDYLGWRADQIHKIRNELGHSL